MVKTINGKLVKRISVNRRIYEEAILREPLGRRGEAELLVIPNPNEEEFARCREILIAAGFPRDLNDPLAPGTFNGYVMFPKRSGPRFPRGSKVLLDFIPVHGGITYHKKDSFADTWGFDTHHNNSGKVDRTNPEWVASQCHVLFLGLQAVEEMAPRFVKERNEFERRVLLQKLFEIYPHEGDAIDSLGFGALVRILTGGL